MREKEKRKVLNRSMREGNINNDKKKKRAKYEHKLVPQ